jgi:polysaccharide biosynthesis protein PslH
MKRPLKILFLSRWFPYPVDNGSKIRVHNLIKHLSSRHEVDLISFSEGTVQDDYVKELHHVCRKVQAIPYRSFHSRGLSNMALFLSRYPRSVKATYHREMAQLVEGAKVSRQYDVVIASQMDMAPYALLVEDAVRILEEIELTTFYEASNIKGSFLRRARNAFMWRKWAWYVRYLLLSFHGATVVSDLELERVVSVAPSGPPVKVVPNGVDVSLLGEDFGNPKPDSLVFSGSLTYGPNFEAIDYFLKEIFPLVLKDIPDAKLVVTGKLDGVALEQLPDCPGVKFTGFLSEIHPVIAQSWVNIVPLRTGGGTRLKVLESLGLGTPVVSTPKGVEGLDLIPGQDCLVGEDARSFAKALTTLLKDEMLRRRLSINGQRTVIDRYDWEKVGPSFCDFVENLTGMGKLT